MSSRSIFISYSHDDYLIVQNLSTLTPGSEDLIWIDRSILKPGDVWREKIDKALKRSRCLIFFASPTSVKSQEVMKEVDYAIHLRKRVIPVIIKKCDLPYQVSNLHHINLVDEDALQMKIFQDVILGISNRKKREISSETAEVIVESVAKANGFYNNYVLPYRGIWFSSLAGIAIILFAFSYIITDIDPIKSIDPDLNTHMNADDLKLVSGSDLYRTLILLNIGAIISTILAVIVFFKKKP